MTSMISLIVVLLAAYAYSAPIVPDYQNTTEVPEVENATVGFQAANVLILARREATIVNDNQNGRVTVGLSSSESDSNETTDTPSPREFEDESTSESNMKRETDTELRDPLAVSDNVRSYTEDSYTTESNMKRETDAEIGDPSAVIDNVRSYTEDSYTTENTKRGIEVESFESSTADEETSTVEQSSVFPSSYVQNAKRSFDNQPWLGSQSDDSTMAKRSLDNQPWLGSQPDNWRMAKRSLDNQPWLGSQPDNWRMAKRSLDNQPWLASDSNEKLNKRSVQIVESSTDVDETSTGEDSSVPSTSEMTNMKHAFGQFPSLTTEANEAFNRRAIGSVESVEAGESSTVIAIRFQPESTTDEQPSSSSSTVEYTETTETVRGESSSTSDYETTVAPVEESTSVSSVPSDSTSKILAIIPGTISRTQYVVPPVEQAQLSQGQNQTIVEARKPNY